MPASVQIKNIISLREGMLIEVPAFKKDPIKCRLCPLPAVVECTE